MLVFGFDKKPHLTEVQDNHQFSEFETVFDLPIGTSNLALRYALDGKGGFMDAYAGLTDEEVFIALATAEEEKTKALEEKHKAALQSQAIAE